MSDRPYVDFKEVKEKVPIPDVLEKLGIREQFRERKGVLVGVCPFPQHTHGPKPNADQFVIDNKQDGLWLFKCFGDCDCGGDVIRFVELHQELSSAHARLWFADHFGDRLTAKPGKKADAKADSGESEAKPVERQQPPRSKPAAKSDDPKSLSPLRFFLNLDPNVPYLVGRGVAHETIERYGIGSCSKGFFNGYVCMPIYRHPLKSSDEYPVGYVGRWPGDWEAHGKTRYLLPKGFQKQLVVYGLGEALQFSRDDEPLIVVEGPFKVFHLVKYGYNGVVSVLGHSMSDEQAELLARTGRRIVLLFDGGTEGYAGMRAAAGKLITQCYVRVVKLPDGTEPDMIDPELRDALLHAI